MICNSNDKSSSPLKLLLTNMQASKLFKDFVYSLLANIKLSKNQLSKMMQSGEPPGRLIRSFLNTCILLMKKRFENVSINSSSISSRLRNIQKNIRIGDDNINNFK